MPIETLSDIVEELADRLGVYGAHEDGESHVCRTCFTINLEGRIEAAVEIEQQLERATRTSPNE